MFFILSVTPADASDPVNGWVYCNSSHEPEVSSDRVVGNSWRAYRVRVPEQGRLWASITSAVINAQHPSMQIYWLAPDGTRTGGGSGFPNGGHTQVHAGGVAVGTGTVHLGCAGGAALAQSYPLPQGEYVAVLVAADRSEFTGLFNVFGSAGTTLLGSTQGPASYFSLADMAQEATWVAVAPAGIDTSDVDSASLEYEAQHRMFFNFAASQNNTQIGWDGPDGSHDGWQGYIHSDGAAGTYTFRVTEAVADSDLFVALADVVLP